MYRDDLDNNNKPQYLFVTDDNENIFKNIKIFRTEELNIKNKELNDFLGFNINTVWNNVNKDYSKYLNNDTISIIESFYEKDFEIFGFAKKPKKINNFTIIDIRENLNNIQKKLSDLLN